MCANQEHASPVIQFHHARGASWPLLEVDMLQLKSEAPPPRGAWLARGHRVAVALSLDFPTLNGILRLPFSPNNAPSCFCRQNMSWQLGFLSIATHQP